MNITLVAAFGISFLLFAVTLFRGIDIAMIFNFDAFVFVVGGTIVALFVGFPVKRIRDTVHHVIDTYKNPIDREEVIRGIVDIARLHRRSDIRGIENRMNRMGNVFLKRGASLLINNNSDKEIRDILERETMINAVDFNFSQNLLKTVARLTPSFGLAGTVISLIRMFSSFQTIEEITPLMAVALMSTLYGVIISNLFMIPLCAKINERAVAAETVMHTVTEGIIAVNNREHPLKIEERLGGIPEVYEEKAELGNTLAVPGGAHV